ncbi:monovalent cation/H+ antiporter subunit F [Staphylococcus petrasii]|uniref:Monovalent cation/H+ antiporter subunit F n=1 Tax=Staphylococcus petrasii TaxID=1276936 RepID=A0A380G2P6_9STAP|nr:Na(+)/H(+) antiporter subunit F1 [Staphylococcus petrasii]MCI2773534.1 Na(+)/H(+) antiporter subunit F1 [Staphylococcus petrasii]PNZ30745.1 Na(+)/H(+) antiporter subunit F [Staphylococcus petrasii]PNZ82893.1 Na(+)/H(+) antiporter subunit F [Staphylococcus petrasii]TGA82286.1 Na(+)/H(+) antiporter subunit F1 [Staphylococcus petrasii]TGE11652.1 Na(+)/H(+) antiporter subunit F1 [Staphylococcus petrasii]
MVKLIMLIALIIVVLSMLAMFIRIIKGPTLADRILALDAVGLQLMACVALYSIFIGAQYLLVAILLIGILAFLGTAVFSKYIDKGKVIEHDSNHHD